MQKYIIPCILVFIIIWQALTGSGHKSDADRYSAESARYRSAFEAEQRRSYNTIELLQKELSDSKRELEIANKALGNLGLAGDGIDAIARDNEVLLRELDKQLQSCHCGEGQGYFAL